MAGAFTEANVFDFDGTLFRSPVPQTMHWDRSARGRIICQPPEGLGWFQSPLSLLPPLVPQHPRTSEWFNPAVEQAARDSMRATTALTVLMTGRTVAVSQRVRQLLDGAGLAFDYYFFKPDETAATLDNKLAQLQQLLDAHPSVRVVNMWDDRHASAFAQWLESRVREQRLVAYNVVEVKDGDGQAFVPHEVATVRKLAQLYNERHGLLGSPNAMTVQSRVQFTAFVLNAASRERLLAYATGTHGVPGDWIRPASHYSIIRRGQAQPHMLAAYGGLGTTVAMRIVAVRRDVSVCVVQLQISNAPPLFLTVAHARGHRRGDDLPPDETQWHRLAVNDSVLLHGYVDHIYANAISGGRKEATDEIALPMAFVDHLMNNHGTAMNRISSSTRTLFNLQPRSTDEAFRVLRIAGTLANVEAARAMMETALDAFLRQPPAAVDGVNPDDD